MTHMVKSFIYGHMGSFIGMKIIEPLGHSITGGARAQDVTGQVLSGANTGPLLRIHGAFEIDEAESRAAEIDPTQDSNQPKSEPQSALICHTGIQPAVKRAVTNTDVMKHQGGPVNLKTPSNGSIMSVTISQNLEKIKSIFGENKGIKGIDGLRAFCVLLVLGHHAKLILWPNLGALGVWIFFSISGFLIIPILFDLRLNVESNKISIHQALWQFFFNRSIRIIPLYYSVLLFIITPPIIYSYFKGALSFNIYADILPFLYTYTSNFYVGFILHRWPGAVAHFWSLAIEQQFYVIFPLMLLFIRTQYWYIFIIFVLFLSISTSIYEFYRVDEIEFYVNSLSGFYAILVGGFCGLIYKPMGKLIPVHIANFLAFSVTFTLLLSHCVFVYFGLFNISLISVPLLSSLLIVIIANHQDTNFVKMLNTPILRGIGTISYGFYVFHLLILPLSGRFTSLALGQSSATPSFTYVVINFLLAMAFTLMSSIISYVYFEKMFLRRKYSNR